MLLEVFCCGPLDTNAILVGCEKTKRALLVDAPPDSFEIYLERLQANSLMAERLVLTHSHLDHIADAAKLQRELKIPLFMHESDRNNVMKPGSDRIPLMLEIEPATPDGYLADGEEFTIGELEIRVITTPGHTAGSICLYFEKERVLLSGDTLFRGTIGNIHFPGSQPHKMWESLKRLAKLPPETRVIPGHGEETTIGEEQWMVSAKERFEF